MKTYHVIIKSLKEQIRSYWVLLLTLSMGPFFIFVYFLILETSKPVYRIEVLNEDNGILLDGRMINHGQMLIDLARNTESISENIPFRIETVSGREDAEEKIKQRKADALIIIDRQFSESVTGKSTGNKVAAPEVEFEGDITNTGYLISAVWANEVINRYVLSATHSQETLVIKETPLGMSSEINDFDLIVPGLLIVSVIMLMFTASIAFVTEVENRTIIRLRLSGLKSIEFVSGITVVQLMTGLVSIFLTLATALVLGFNYSGSLFTLALVAALTSLSIIAFSLIIAALTKTANEILVAGNFPLLLFMFFSGAAFPLKSEPLLSVAGYPLYIQSIMSPTHAISALNKTLIMDMDLKSIVPEISAIMILTMIYFVTGAFLFNRRHLKLG